MKTEIICITDRSGSMASIENDANGGFNSFIEAQKSVDGEARVTHVWFDTEYELLYRALPIASVPPMRLQPRGGTALLDAIGRTLNDQGKRIKDEGWADLVIVCILTDGGENSSVEYTRTRIQEMVSHAEATGWKFVFLAANQDAFAAARSLGSAGVLAKNFSYDGMGTTMAYAATSASVTALRAGHSLQAASDLMDAELAAGKQPL